MSKPKLSDIEVRAEGATEGPWIPYDLADAVYDSKDAAGWWWVWREKALPYYGGVLEVEHDGHEAGKSDEAAFKGAIGQANITDNNQGEVEHRDAAFIAAARTDVPALTAAVRAVLDLRPRAWSEDEADSMEARTARAYNSALNDARKALAAHLDLS